MNSKNLLNSIRLGILMLGLILCSGYVNAQVSAYTFTALSGTYTDISGGTGVATSTSVANFLGDTRTSVSIPIGFTFVFDGVGYTDVKAGSDGFISFNSSATSTAGNNLSTTAAARRPLIAPLWDDLDGASGSGEANYITTGAPGSQVFTLEWKNWQWDYAATGATISFQVKLYETTNVIEFIYRQESGSLNSADASIGLAGVNTGAGNFLSLSDAGTSPSVSSTSETNTIGAKPATGQIYRFTPPPLCSGQPALGQTTASVPGACPGVPFTLGVSGIPIESGYTYEFESSPAGANTYTSLGAPQTASAFTVSNQTAATDYRVIVTCTGSTLSTTATEISVPMQPFYNCYCAPASNCTNEGIENVSFNTINNTSTYCAATSGYSDYGSLGSLTTVAQAQQVAMSVTAHINSNPAHAGVWIDYDHNGTFDAGEYTSLGTATVTIPTGGISHVFTGTVTIAPGALTGITRMRVRSANQGGITNASSCTNSGIYGEYEDYLVNIDPGTACSGAPVAGTVNAPAGVCSGTDFTLTATGYTTGVLGMSYLWEVYDQGTASWGPAPGANADTFYTAAGGITTATDYRFVITCVNGGGVDYAGPVTVNINPPTQCYCTPATTSTNYYINNFTTTGAAVDISNTASGYSAGGLGDFTATQSVSILPGGSFNFAGSFGSSTTGTYGVKIWIDWDQDGSFAETGDQVFATSAYTSAVSGTISIPLTASAMTTRMRVGANYNSATGPATACSNFTNGEYEDYSITILPPPACFAPSALTAGNVLMNSAELGWTENGGATLWSVEYGPQGFTPGTGTYVSGTAANPYTATGLTANTFYDFYVRSVCNASDSSALAGPFTFVTKQVPVNTFPWTEDWETGGTEWTIMNGTQVNKWSVGTATDNGGAQSLYISNDNGTSNAYTLGTTAVVQAFRDIAVPSGMPAISLSFDWKADGEGTLSTTSYDYFRVWLVPVSYLPTPGTQITAAGSGGIQLGGNLLDQASFTAANLVIPGSYAGTTFRLVFEWRNDGGSGAQPPAAIDNVQMIVGSCPQPASLTVANPAANSADLGWTEAGTASLWQIEYAATGFTQGSGTLQMAGTNPYPLSGLSPNTTYDFYVRSVCSPGDSSDWTGPFTFATACLPVTSLPWTETFESSSATKNCWKVVNANNDGDQWSLNGTGYPFTGTVHAQMYTDGNGGANDDWLITPAITLSGNQQLRYWYRARSASEPNDYTVLLSTTGFAPGDFTNTLLPLTSVSNIAYAQNTINLSTYTGTVYIAFRVPPGGLDGWYLFLDDVTVEDIPTCFNPTGLGTANATTGGADINWTASASGPTSGYDYYVDTSSLPPAAGVTPAGSVGAGVLTATLSGYAPATTYYVWVRANCGSGDVSSWEGPASFTTLCPVSFTPNYSQDFSAYIPSCWAEQEGALTASATLTGTTSAWLSDSWMNSTTSNGQAARINLFNTGDRDWLVTPSIDLGTAGNYYLQFNVAFLDYGTVNGLSLGSDDTLAVVISTDNGATWSLTNVLQTWTAANSSFTSQYITIPLTAYTGIVKFGFYGSEGVVDDPNDVDVMIDNFLVTNTPLAIRLTNIYAANDGSRNRVNWITSAEAKGDYFIVERSADGRNYTALGTVGVKGKPSAYTYWDETPVEGINYYRLRMSDASGSFEYSKVVTAAVKGHGTFSVDAYPNPVREILTVRINGVLAGDAAITVTDIAGKVVRTVMPGSNIVTLDMKDMAKGVYIVRYSDADHSQVIKVNKQ